jgi:hypothetical protein
MTISNNTSKEIHNIINANLPVTNTMHNNQYPSYEKAIAA